MNSDSSLLGDWIRFRNGKTSPQRFKSGRLPVFGSNGVIGFSDQQNVDGQAIVIGRVGSHCGSTYYSPTSSWVTDNAIIARAEKEDETRFWYYVLSFLELNHLSQGSGQPLLNQSILKSVPFVAPDRRERLTIASTLGALDDKIESNERILDQLEELGGALLEAELRLDVYGFPSYEADRRLGSMLSVLETGSRPRGGVVATETGVVSLGAESIQSAGIISTKQFKRVSNEFASSMRRGRLEDGDVLVYKDGGRPGNFIPHISAFGQGFPETETTINEHVYRVRAANNISQGLLYWILCSQWMDVEMRKRGTGVAIPGLNSSNFRDLPWPSISQESISRLNESLDPALTVMLRLGAENRRLASLRDTLLPELLSLRIRVPIEGATA